MRGRLLAVAIVVGTATPGTALAGDTPWSTIKQLFHEPVTELKQQLRKLERRLPASKVAPVSKPAPKEAPAAAVIPPKRPDISSPADTPAAAKADVPPEPTTTTEAPPDPASPADSVADIPPPDPAPTEPAAEPAEAAIEASAAETPMAEPDDVETATAPIPRPRPDVATSYAAAPPADRSDEAFSALNLPPPSLTKPPPAARSTCGAELARLGVVVSALTPVSEGACGIARPVSVASLGGGATELTANAIIECNLAEAFAHWLADEVQPEARKTLGGEVTGLRIAASYHCRTRNGISGAKLSEHGRGNAIDISAFEIAGRWIAVGGSNSADEARFFRAIRKSACGPFTTVLGPGSDRYHSDHFHLDLAKRNKNGRSRGLYCR